ncbi:hypothetical protein Ga0466249_001670 [Sporomusaceae bacterium BoRhaA]|uniref:hypothetical protein n=1 Tax=Pelorhabdus rhamnosifermentans TaxID=2772457 RepID=UPI001C05F192|nr:hypothetical protein [Pelorhabdus rhamnosifermentans]MBU2700578.1 hypothetical protein [Pelorhabdus rhamnosifermentans]
MGKIFVKITAEHDTNGTVRPLEMIWSEGRCFSIDRILDVRKAASLKGGGLGMRYICRICGKQVNLFDDEGRWFIEV